MNAAYERMKKVTLAYPASSEAAIDATFDSFCVLRKSMGVEDGLAAMTHQLAVTASAFIVANAESGGEIAKQFPAHRDYLRQVCQAILDELK